VAVELAPHVVCLLLFEIALRRVLEVPAENGAFKPERRHVWIAVRVIGQGPRVLAERAPGEIGGRGHNHLIDGLVVDDPRPPAALDDKQDSTRFSRLRWIGVLVLDGDGEPERRGHASKRVLDGACSST
jgi:hypothetical protein